MQSRNCSGEAFQIETFKWHFRNRVHKWFLVPSSCYSLFFPLEEHLFHFTGIGNMICSLVQLHCEGRRTAMKRTMRSRQDAHRRREERTKKSHGVGKNKLYNRCCLGTLAGTNREATNYHYKRVFLLQLQRELHTRGGRGSAINHIIFTVPLMLLAMLQETPSIPR